MDILNTILTFFLLFGCLLATIQYFRVYRWPKDISDIFDHLEEEAVEKIAQLPLNKNPINCPINYYLLDYLDSLNVDIEEVFATMQKLIIYSG